MQKESATLISGLVVIQPNVYRDDRGAFFETYHREKYLEEGIEANFVQDNEATSKCGVLRGLHYQVGTMAQAKLVRVVQGSAYDVVVDLRPGSASFGDWYGIELTAENRVQLFVPRGFAHGYLALQDDTILCYKCDNFYSREHEGGLRYDDPAIGISWPSLDGQFIISDKDLALPNLGNHRT